MSKKARIADTRTTGKVNKSTAKRTSQPAAKAVAVQTKLKVGEPNDAYEKDADQMADRVVSIPSATSSPQTNLAGTQIQRKGDDELQPKMLVSSTQEHKPTLQTKPLSIQRKETAGKGTSASPWVQSTIASTRGQGQKMDGQTQGFMENRFGADFSKVNIHTNANAIQMSEQLGAKAFTTGNDIYFNKSQYQPGNQAGQKLIAHELTHTLQQTGTIQKQEYDDYDNEGDFEDEEVYDEGDVEEDYEEDMGALDDALNAELAILGEQINEAEQQKDYESMSFLIRVELILGSNSFTSLEQFKKFLEKANQMAKSERNTIDHVGGNILRLQPMAFPVTWANLYFNAMYLKGIDMEALKKNAVASDAQMKNTASEIPFELYKKGLPIPYDDLANLTKFEPNVGHAKMDGDHIVKRFMIAALDFVGHGWAYNFVRQWNNSVELTSNSIEDGEIVMSPADYDLFISKQGNIIPELGNLFMQKWTAKDLEDAQLVEDDLTGAALVTFFVNGLGSIAHILQHWGIAHELFDEKKDKTVPILLSLDHDARLEKAIEWADALGYFGEAGAHIAKSLRDNGWQIIGMVMLMIGALTASHVYPPLGIALDILLLIWSGISVAHAIGNLTDAISAFHRIRSVEDFQKKSGKLAQSLIGDGLTVILEVATLFVSLGIGHKIRAIKARNTRLSTEEALVKALEDSSPTGIVAKTKGSQSFIEAAGNTKAARNAVRESKGKVAEASQILLKLKELQKSTATKLAEMHKANPDLILDNILRADYTAKEIRFLHKNISKVHSDIALTPAESSRLASLLKQSNMQKSLIFSGANDIDAIWKSGKYWGQTEGAAYGARMPVNTFWERMKAMVKKKEGLVVFQGQAAALFNPHKVSGPYSFMKRTLGQQKAGFGDIIFEEFTRHGSTIIVTRASISTADHAARWHRAKNISFGSNTFWAGARLFGRMAVIEPIMAATIAGTGLAIFMAIEDWLGDE